MHAIVDCPKRGCNILRLLPHSIWYVLRIGWMRRHVPRRDTQHLSGSTVRLRWPEPERGSPAVTPGRWPATMNENDYTSLTTPLALRSVDSRAASRSAVGSRCPEAWPFVASLVDSTQESICYERAPCWRRRPTLG